MRAGKAAIVTDEIEMFTEHGVLLKSGSELHADVIVTATGLEVLFLGGAELRIDGKLIEPNKCLVYRAMVPPRPGELSLR